MLEYLADTVRRIAFQGSTARRECAHVDAGGVVPPANPTCAGPSCHDALKLRMCLTCSTVGCCDSSPGQHARAHYEATGHPTMRSVEPGETWAWCYPDQAYLTSTEPRT
jgi:CPA1 family monovalent cation:H+ antiporter